MSFTPAHKNRDGKSKRRGSLTLGGWEGAGHSTPLSSVGILPLGAPLLSELNMKGRLSGAPNGRASGAPQRQTSGVLLPQSITVPLFPAPPCKREHFTRILRRVKMTTWTASASKQRESRIPLRRAFVGLTPRPRCPQGTPCLQEAAPSVISPAQPLTDRAHARHTRKTADGRASNTDALSQQWPARSRSSRGRCFEMTAGKPALPEGLRGASSSSRSSKGVKTACSF